MIESAQGSTEAEPIDLARFVVRSLEQLARPKVSDQAPLVVAFSGGADSSALLLALATARRHRLIDHPLVVAHINHGLDRGSNHRARQARRLVHDLERLIGPDPATGHALTKWREVAIDPTTAGPENRGLEANARRARYRELELLRRETGARYVLTGHQIDDQLETQVLRLRQGTGLGGMSGIRRRLGSIVRPFLGPAQDPGPSARQLRSILRAAQVDWIEDETNQQLSIQRNYVRRMLLPELLRIDPQAASEAQRLAVRSAKLRSVLDRRLLGSIDHSPATAQRHASVSLKRWLELAAPLQDPALNALHRSAGANYPPTRAGKQELRRQLASQVSRAINARSRVGCDCGRGWRWRAIHPSEELARLELFRVTA